jgi:hypothetical protein
MNIDHLLNDLMDEKTWEEQYLIQTQNISRWLKSVNKAQGLTELKSANPSDLSLMSLFVYSLKQEDYEICEIAHTLLKERGLEFQSDKWKF